MITLLWSLLWKTVDTSTPCSCWTPGTPLTLTSASINGDFWWKLSKTWTPVWRNSTPGGEGEKTILRQAKDGVEVWAKGQMWTDMFFSSMFCLIYCTSRLFVVSGPPIEVLPKLFEKWKITRLTFEVDTEPYSQSRDKEVMKLAKEYGVEAIPKISHTLHNIDR